ncbi:MAG: LacI family DNA-binding transcriptional regulator [Chitinophagaceae bacterium]|nr:LacI family DNA-binding transcriptional regulator [Chitinophagaceae bacterium]
MKFEAITIKDIARALGLSTSTVSRALRDSYQISPETKKLVLEYAKKINYSPNPIALSLKEKRSRSIGVIVCEIANSFFSQAINGIESIAYDRGYNVIITQSHESYEREVNDLQFLASRSIDGLLISVSSETKNFDHLMDLQHKGLPIVFFDRIFDDIETHKVMVNNFKGSFDATSHLIKNGYRHIAHLANSDSLSITRERAAGYCEALKHHGIEVDESYIKYCAHGGMLYQEVEEALNLIMKHERLPQAVFAAGDKLTTGFLRYFKAKGIKVPEQIALAGFSNLDLTDLLNPSLTVVRQPAFEMGKAATNLLLSQVESKRPVNTFQKIVLEPELLIRDSSRPPHVTPLVPLKGGTKVKSSL